jgi:arsenite methyltransferase
METQEQIKEMVRQKYSEIALQDKGNNEASCCGSGCCTTDVYNIMTDDYANLEGYAPEADLAWDVAFQPSLLTSKKEM